MSQGGDASSAGPTIRNWPAPAYTGVILAIIALVVLALDHRSAAKLEEPKLPPSVGDPVFANSVGWLTWRVVAAVAIVAFLGLGFAGVRMLARRERHDLAASETRTGVYLGCAFLLAGGGIALVVVSGGRNPDIPVYQLAARTRTVLFTGLISFVPWFVLAWLTQDRCRSPEQRPWRPERDSDVLSFDKLTTLWNTLLACVRAFALGVSAALLTSGALRFAFLEAHPECAPAAPDGSGCVRDFPANNVLLYGAVFALVSLAISLPLLWSWRGQASAWVDEKMGPPADPPDEAWTTERDRLRGLMRLNTPILRDPLTLLSVFTPLVTSLLAAFLPQLGD